MNYKCRFGNSLYVCGNIPALGNWDPSKALQMNWKEVNHEVFLYVSIYTYLG